MEDGVGYALIGHYEHSSSYSEFVTNRRRVQPQRVFTAITPHNAYHSCYVR